MRILVCFKIVDDIEALLPEDWQSLGRGAPDTSYVRRVLGCFDEAAMENALRLKETLTERGEKVEVTALTVDPGYSEHILKNLPAVQVDRVVCAESGGADLRFSPEATAGILARFAKEAGPFHLVLTGCQAPPGNSGMVPPLLAEALGVPCLTNVTDLAAEVAGLRVEQQVAGGICTRVARMPLLCAMGNARYSYLRMPTLQSKIKTKGVKPDWIKVERGPTRFELHDLHRDEAEKECLWMDGENASQKVRMLYSLLLKESLEE